MNREVLSKVMMVTVLVGALVVTIVLAGKAGDDTAPAPSAPTPALSKDDMKREIQGVMRRAIFAFRQDDFKTAEKLLVEASERFPQVPAVWLNLGICYRGVGKLDAADRAFARVLELDPKDWDAVAERGTVRIMRKQLDKAFDELEKIPPGKGQMGTRLRTDDVWLEHRANPRMAVLRKKHGVSDADLAADSSTTAR